MGCDFQDVFGFPGMTKPLEDEGYFQLSISFSSIIQARMFVKGVDKREQYPTGLIM